MAGGGGSRFAGGGWSRVVPGRTKRVCGVRWGPRRGTDLEASATRDHGPAARGSRLSRCQPSPGARRRERRARGTEGEGASKQICGAERNTSRGGAEFCSRPRVARIFRVSSEGRDFQLCRLKPQTNYRCGIRAINRRGGSIWITSAGKHAVFPSGARLPSQAKQ